MWQNKTEEPSAYKTWHQESVAADIIQSHLSTGATAPDPCATVFFNFILKGHFTPVMQVDSQYPHYKQ